MYKIIRGCGIVEKGAPYLIVTASQWQDQNIDLERFILVVGPKEAAEVILRTRISSDLRGLPKDPALDLAKLLEEEILLAKAHYGSWLYAQIGDKAFIQMGNLVWQEVKDIESFALVCYRFNQEARRRLKEVADNSFCEELRRYIGRVSNLRLIIEEKENLE
ncbi:MAG: hypothetical protein Q8Q08_03640 [Candidatus Omnitrophota bacterium]|nr:hypothetical protein [Candidatus Omnitrophota bacterium]